MSYSEAQVEWDYAHRPEAEVERLTKEVERLRAVLERLTDGYKYSTEVVTIARDALGEKVGQ